MNAASLGIDSVTRFGEISPLWEKSLRQFFKAFLVFFKIFNILGKNYMLLGNFPKLQMSKIEK